MFSIIAFSTDYKIGQPYQLVYSVQIIHCAQYRHTGDPNLPIVQLLFSNAKTDDIQANNEKSKVLHSFNGGSGLRLYDGSDAKL